MKVKGRPQDVLRSALGDYETLLSAEILRNCLTSRCTIAPSDVNPPCLHIYGTCLVA
jgi:hypothetical protein